VTENDKRVVSPDDRAITRSLSLRWRNVLIAWAALGAGVASSRLSSSTESVVALVACAAALTVFAILLARPVERLAEDTRSVALDRPLHDSGAGGPAEVQVASHFLALLRGSWLQSRKALAATSIELDAGSRTLRDGVARQAQIAIRQSAAVTETSATAAEIAQTAKAAAQHADEVLEVAQRAEDLSAEGQQVLEKTVSTIRDLADQVHSLSGAITESAQRSRHIGEIVAGLKDLAEQTNLLSLNASIEAVKAGERGRGFSVVAIEMGNLAEQSKSAAAKVRHILDEIDKGTRAATAIADEGARRARGALALAEDAGKAISGIGQAIRDSSVAARQIANNTRQQGIGVEQIVAALGDISAASQEVVAANVEMERAAASLSALAGRIGSADQTTEEERS
jgi:methyl-accepting chemotaxis protein